MITEEVPQPLKDVFDIVYKDFDRSEIKEITQLTERDAVFLHHGYGTYLRNSLYLWWHEGHSYKEWPKQKPEIVAWFNSECNIFHADDMSGIILTSFIRTVRGENIRLEDQIRVYKKHWEREGFKDGIFERS